MDRFVYTLIIAGALVLITGCETTSSRPYSASTENVFMMKTTLTKAASKIKLGDFKQAENSSSLVCRLNGPIDVSPGKSQAQFIKEALQTELFMADAYDVGSDIELSGALNSLKFSSVSPANWTINFTISSNKSDGYTVETVYPFKTSFSAYSACRNVADSFAPAVQQLISDILKNPKFTNLVNG